MGFQEGNQIGEIRRGRRGAAKKPSAGMVYRAWIEYLVDCDHALIVSELNPRHDRVYVGMLTTNQLELSTVMPWDRIQIWLWPGWSQSGACTWELCPYEGHTCFVRYL